MYGLDAPHCYLRYLPPYVFMHSQRDDLSCSQVRPVLFPGAIGLHPLFPDPDSVDLW